MGAFNINLDQVSVLNISAHTGAKFSLRLTPSIGVLDLINAKIHLTDSSKNKLLKTYSIGSGLVVDGDDIIWEGEMTDLKSEKSAAYDAYVSNVDTKRRNFHGTIKTSSAWAY
jgi:hypothetical protein